MAKVTEDADPAALAREAAHPAREGQLHIFSIEDSQHGRWPLPMGTHTAPPESGVAVWISLRRAHQGGVANLSGHWLDSGRRVPGYVADALDELTSAGLLALGEEDPKFCRARRITVTDTGCAHYVALYQVHNPQGRAAVSTPQRWARSPHDQRSHLLTERGTDQIGVLVGVCGHRMLWSVPTSAQPTGHTCPTCEALPGVPVPAPQFDNPQAPAGRRLTPATHPGRAARLTSSRPSRDRPVCSAPSDQRRSGHRPPVPCWPTRTSTGCDGRPSPTRDTVEAWTCTACGLHWCTTVVNPTLRAALSVIGLLPTPQQRTAALLAVLLTEVTQREREHTMAETVCFPRTAIGSSPMVRRRRHPHCRPGPLPPPPEGRAGRTPRGKRR